MRDNQYYIQQCLERKAELEEKINETESIIEHLNDYRKLIKKGEDFDEYITNYIVDRTIDLTQELEGYLEILKEKKEENEESYSYYLGRE